MHENIHTSGILGTLHDLLGSFPFSPRTLVKEAYDYQIKRSYAFLRQYSLLRESQWWDATRLGEYQVTQMRKLIRHAYANVPYYKRVLDAAGLTPDNVREAQDLRRIPCLTKDAIKANFEEMVAKNASRSRLSVMGTSGTTGMPLAFYADRPVIDATDFAFVALAWNRVGYRFGDKTAVLRGVKYLAPNRISAFDSGNRLRLSSLAMTEENMLMYTKLLREYNPRFIQALPSSIFLLARFMKENGIPPFPNVKALLLASEVVHEFQRKVLEDVFNCRVFSTYGQLERTVLAGECECSTCYHVSPEYGVTELIGRDGEPVTEDGESGEIVGTGFLNWATPFIRYRTGDIATYTSKKCRCGRNYPLLESLQGRIQEYVVAYDGSLLPFTALAIAYNNDVGWTNERIKQIQFLQEERGEIIIYVTKVSSFSDSEVIELLLEWSQTRLSGFKVTVNVVDEILPTESGKYKYLIQKLPIRFQHCD